VREPRRRDRGITIFDLLTVLAIVALLAAVASPPMSAMLPAVRLEHAARALASEAQLARAKAIARGRRVRLVVRLERDAYSVESDRSGRFEPDGAERTLAPGVKFDRAASTRVANDTVTIVFQPRGHTADNATIALASAGHRRRVIVSPAGRVRVE
jgi:type IV fimbrial biogenesis protein FimT